MVPTIDARGSLRVSHFEDFCQLTIRFVFLALKKPSLSCAFFQLISDFFLQTVISTDFGVRQTGVSVRWYLVTLFHFLLIWVMSAGQPFEQSYAMAGRRD